MQKKAAKLRLFRSVLLLEEFIEIGDKKGSERVIANHLIKLITKENDVNALPIPGKLLNDQLLHVRTSNLS